jgi:hypothetical protein
MNKVKNLNSHLTSILRSSSFRKTLLSILIGGLIGFLYYYFVGCEAGSCSITSDPYGSIFMGSLLGFFIGGDSNSKQTTGKTNNNK